MPLALGRHDRQPERRVVDPTPRPQRQCSGEAHRRGGRSTFSPEPTGIGPYTHRSLAITSTASGADVTVITGIPHYPAWRAEPGTASAFAEGRRTRKSTYGACVTSCQRKQNAVSRAILRGEFLAPSEPRECAGHETGHRGDSQPGRALAGSALAHRLKCPLVVVVTGPHGQSGRSKRHRWRRRGGGAHRFAREAGRIPGVCRRHRV